MRPASSLARHRDGFTLVELMAAIFIIAFLMGLLLPAVEAAREAARRASCSNNLMQLSIAVFNFESHHARLPTGVINDKPGPIRSEPIGQHVSWIVQLLPQLERGNIYEQFDRAAGVYAPVNAALRSRSMPVLRCPSSTALPAATIAADLLADNGYINTYAACHDDIEAPIDRDNHGVMFLNSRLSVTDIEDGSSHTIMLGEFLPDASSLGWASGTRSTLRNTGTAPNGIMASLAPPRPAPLIVGGFGSNHTGGANFARCDGSIGFLSQTIDVRAYQRLGHRSDGILFSDSDY